ncbi:MAG: hypothetical protein JSS32_03185 [Verrucomicrobia bacterium]|nr:hypothetical protein [Verrucomicrobiota bacterium]
MQHAISSWIQRSWWVVAFSAVVGLIYMHALKDRNAALAEISFRFQEMEKERFMVLQEKEDLQLRIASQNDPAWIEMVLMREIGVVPEGWIKVHFQTDRQL